MTTLTRTYQIQASHWLPRTHVNHKCHNRHGHNFKIDLSVTGPMDEEYGWIVDYQFIDNIFTGAVTVPLDHKEINDVIENPTSENIASWVYQRMTSAFGQVKPELRVVSVVVRENEKSACTYQPE